MDKEYQIAVLRLKQLLEPFTDEYCHIVNIQSAKILFPYNTIPLDVSPEEWKPLNTKRFIDGRYLVSSWGRVYDKKLEQYPYTHLCDKGYVRIALERNPLEFHESKNTHPNIRVHRLIADAFIPYIEGKELVNHIDTIKTNNTLANLEWTTNQENLDHATKNGCNLNKGGHRYFTREQINDIRERYKKGELLKNIAKAYGRKFRAISDIVNNITYDDLFWENLGYFSNKQYGLHPKD